MIAELEAAMQVAVQEALGLNPQDAKSPEAVRIGWQPSGQPAWEIGEDVCILRVVPEDSSDADRQADIKYTRTVDGTTRQVTYQQVWNCLYTFYGPNAIENGYKVRTALLLGDISETLEQIGAYLVPDIAPPARTPELFEAQWWERADLSARFNQLVVETTEEDAAASVEVVVEKENGLSRDITVNQE
jgi:hypothetical protein